jgi:hypothetical protein
MIEIDRVVIVCDCNEISGIENTKTDDRSDLQL